ncbi:hypothetical protein PoB_001587300 [Plakobranchus ocellatus]|uniref:Uncharacterized protein n=1 Tax=Plakobranchus ocellatus TaxID=259542 RepID=A0AAV3Z409_9GAST|nr:hypothetical protein PoB_001587300 [Plakobranchus ocellatus]
MGTAILTPSTAYPAELGQGHLSGGSLWDILDLHVHALAGHWWRGEKEEKRGVRGRKREGLKGVGGGPLAGDSAPRSAGRFFLSWVRVRVQGDINTQA